MRLKNIKGAKEFVTKNDYIIKNPTNYKGKYKSIFKNKNKIELEIGVGKGDFIIEKAISNPNINYIGVEKYASVLIFAIKKAEKNKLTNIKFILSDAIQIDEIFYKEISKLYLNFSDPWPKKRHEKRRLTSDVFLNKYKSIFKNIKIIEQKTDNDDLFEYSIKSYKRNGYIPIKKSTNYISKYKTEYENKFIKKGKNINYIKVIKLV